MLKIADHTFSSRLFTGTGKFARPELMAAAIEASGSQLVTMAIKRLEPGKAHDDILSPLLQLGVKLLPNTSGAKTAAEAVFAAHLAREALGSAEAVDAIPPLLVRKLHSLELLTPGDFANVVRQRTLLGEALAPEDFLRRLIAECRWKEGVGRSSAVA